MAATGSYSFDATFAGTRTWVAHMATFKGGQSVSGLGFTPEAVLFASVMDITRTVPVAEARLGFGAGDGTSEFTSSTQDQDAVATSRVRNFERSTKVFSKINNNTSTVDAEADLLGFNTDGFTLNWTTNDAVATEMLYVAFAPMWLSEVRLTSFDAARVRQRRARRLEDRLRGRQPRLQPLSRDQWRPHQGEHARSIKGHGAAGRQRRHRQRRAQLRAMGHRSGRGHPASTYWLEDVEFNGKSTLARAELRR